MSDRGESPTPGADEDEATVHLLRAAGPRASVSALRAERVRSAARAAWQGQIRRRAIRRRVASAGALLGAVALALIVGRETLFERNAPARPGDPVAVVDQVDGRSGIQRNDAIRIGEWIETGRDSHVALRFGDGTSVRLDTGSRVRALSSKIVELAAGAVYVDNGHEGDGFEVRTAIATARDIGTQFEVRVLGESLRLRVRTGMVQLTDRARSITGRQGTGITLSANGAVSRPFEGHDPGWEWTTRVAPPLEMEGTSLARFLEHAAREQGWTIVYPDPALAREAEAIVLHGSVKGLAADEAVGVAVATSGLRHRVEHGSLVVLRADAPHTTDRDSNP